MLWTLQGLRIAAQVEVVSEDCHHISRMVFLAVDCHSARLVRKRHLLVVVGSSLSCLSTVSPA
jgi:hypothetical protein